MTIVESYFQEDAFIPIEFEDISNTKKDNIYK